MNKIKLFISIALAILMVASNLGSNCKYVKIAHRLTYKVASKLEREKGLQFVGRGGQMMDDIQMMAMSFDLYHEVDLKTARKLLIDTTREYLLAINNNEEVRPYLHQYPFTAKNIEIRIWIYNPDRSAVEFDKISYICALDGTLTYEVEKPGKHMSTVIHEEAYEDALKLAS